MYITKLNNSETTTTLFVSIRHCVLTVLERITKVIAIIIKIPVITNLIRQIEIEINSPYVRSKSQGELFSINLQHITIIDASLFSVW